MKNNTKIILIIMCMILLGTLTVSCKSSDGKTTAEDKATADKKIDAVLDAIEKQDKKAMTKLFSKETRKEELFAESVEDLLQYFHGTVEEYSDWGGPVVEKVSEGEQSAEIMEMTYDVVTTEASYRFAIRYVVEDTANRDKVGIESLYIINAEMDSNIREAYWGDEQFTPGIHIAVPNNEE